MISTSARKKKESLRPWAVCLWFAIWQGGGMALEAIYPHGALLLATPLSAARRLWELLPEAGFWDAVFHSTARIFGGFLFSCALGTALAALAAANRRFREFLAPAVAAVKAVPVASFIILALVWLDADGLSFFIAALMVFPPVYLNVLEGILQINHQLLEMAEVFRVPLLRRLWGIGLPQVLPYFRSAASLALGLCWKAGAAAEVIGLPDGSIGERLYNAKVYLRTPDLFAWTAVIVALSAALEKGFLAAVDYAAGKAGCK